jgi:hypothetical protein
MNEQERELHQRLGLLKGHCFKLIAKIESIQIFLAGHSKEIVDDDCNYVEDQK